MNYKNGISRQTAWIILENGMCGAALYNSPKTACTFGASALGMPVAIEGRRREYVITDGTAVPHLSDTDPGAINTWMRTTRLRMNIMVSPDSDSPLTAVGDITAWQGIERRQYDMVRMKIAASRSFFRCYICVNQLICVILQTCFQELRFYREKTDYLTQKLEKNEKKKIFADQ